LPVAQRLMSMILDEHRQYLSDVPRLTAYQNAINEVVRPEDVVLDLGAGTGVWGLLACRAGAGRVYSIEATPIIGLTREISKANGFDDRVIFIKGLSTQVDLPEKVDVIICDQIGRFGFEAGILEYFADARKRFLKPGGTLIPSHVSMHAVPVESESLFGNVDFWNNSPHGFDVSPVRQLAANTGYPAMFAARDFLADPETLVTIDLMTNTNASFEGSVSSLVARPGTLHGIGGWFSAQLSRGSSMTNSPVDPNRINRRNVFLPVDRPVKVEIGDRIETRVHVMPSDEVLTWRVKVLSSAGAEKASFVQSTWNGALIAKEDLTRGKPQFVPKLTSRGQARLTVLGLCDGKRTLKEVENETCERHPNVFNSLDEAALFVAEVVTRYSA
jgi:predicted RNA methylase